MHHQEQIGDYVIELPDPRAMWGVRMAGDDQCLSQHNTKADAVKQIKIYQAHDKRRAQNARA